MDNIKLLDCTLREAPLEGLMWGDFSICKMIDGLEKAHVEIIEVGFLKNEPYKFGSTAFQKVEEIKPYLKNKSKDIMYVALVDYGRYNLEYLSEYDGESIDAIRVCFKHHEADKVLDYALAIKDKGYKVCIQHVDTMDFTDEEIIDFIYRVNEVKPFAYSVVDTFGAMYGSDANHYIELAAAELDNDIWLGFHAHNNLMLADANDQLFIEKFAGQRNIIVDTSLYGCGRGAGNAHTELIAQYMNRKCQAKYDINELLDLIDTVIAVVQEKTSWGYNIPYFIAGMHNAHTFNVKQLLKRHNLKSKDLRGIIEMLDDVQKKSYDYALLEKLYVQYFDSPVDDTDSVSTLMSELKDKNIVLLAPGKSVQKYKPEIDEYIKRNNSVVIGVNNLIENYHLDYIFFSGAKRYQNLQYQNFKMAGSPRLIVTSNIKEFADSNEILINYSTLVKFGWVNLDSSVILLLRLLEKCNVYKVSIAGLDGFTTQGRNYYSDDLDTGMDAVAKTELTNDIISMLRDIVNNNPKFDVTFLTESIYSEAIRKHD